jgi:hypothetical protein
MTRATRCKGLHHGVQQEGEVMRILVLIGLLATACLSGGCFSTPAYSAEERNAMIARTWNIEFKQAVDDFDSALLLRPPSRMTIWHVR